MGLTSMGNCRSAQALARPVLVALLGVVTAAPLAAASFDCSKASTVIEKAICSNPRLSRLDEELATTYRDATAHAARPKELKAAQAAWLRTERNACEDDTACLEHAMLLRMATIRSAPEMGVKLFASAVPPKSIFGRYSMTEPVCTYSGPNGEVECEGEAESYIDVQPAEGYRVAVRSELTFFNAHLCDFDSVGEWAGDELRVPSEIEDIGCILILRFRDGKVVTDDPGGRCKDYCGARGGFRGIELPKLSVAEAAEKRAARAAAAESP